MLSESHRGVYRRYKADTNVVAGWLASASSAHGYTMERVPAAKAPAAKGGRLKGKARKAAKQAEKTSVTTSSENDNASAEAAGTAPRKTYVIKIKDFEPMALFLSKVNGLKIPDYFQDALRRVIQVRTDFSKYISDQTPETELSKSRHSHFIQVLQQVQKHLGCKAKSDTQTASIIRRSVSDTTTPVTNPFSALEVYHTTVEYENSPDVIPTPSPEIEYVSEEVYSVSDAIFAFSTLLDDFGRLQEEIMSLWTRYHDGDQDLAAAAVATNIAIELAHAMENEIAPLLSRFGSPTRFAWDYVERVGRASGIPDEHKQTLGSSYHLKLYNTAKISYANTVTYLEGYKHATRSDEFAVQVYSGAFGWYNDKLGGAAKTSSLEWKQDELAMMELFWSLDALSKHMDSGITVDELILGFADMTQNPRKDVPLWLGFAVQVYLNLLQMPGRVHESAFEQMQQEGLRIKKAMMDVPATSPERNAVLSVVTAWDEDQLYTELKRLVQKGVLGPNVLRKPFTFLRRNPLYCGLHVHCMRVAMHHFGTTYIANSGVLVGVIQLYNALGYSGLINKDGHWADLEKILKLQGHASFFVGEPPTNFKGSFTNYCVGTGTSIRNLAADRKSEEVKINKSNQRRLRFLGFLSLATTGRLIRPSPRLPCSFDEIIHLLDLSIKKRFTNSRGHFISAHQGAVDARKLLHKELPPSGLIHQIAHDIQYEKEGICFNLFTLHGKIRHFLRLLRDELSKAFSDNTLLKDQSEINVLPYVCGMILQLAAGHDIKGNPQFLKTDTLVVVAAALMQEFLAAGHGRAALEALNSRKKLKASDVADLDYEPRG